MKKPRLQRPAFVTAPTTVDVHVGLAGAVVPVVLEPGTSMDAVKTHLRLALPEASIMLSAGGDLLESVESLLLHHGRGELIFATCFRDVSDLSLAEVALEMSMEDAEFQGHLFTLSKISRTSTPRSVATYLWDNQLLLTAAQAQRLFDVLVPRLVQCPDEYRIGLRGQLILALHSFCVEPYAIWEPDDGNDGCVWANMAWGGGSEHPSMSGLCYLTRGSSAHLQTAAFADAAAYQKDISGLRAVLQAHRAGNATPLRALCNFEAYGRSWSR